MKDTAPKETPKPSESQSQAGPNGMAVENRTGLPDSLKAGVESLSGMPLDDVRVHYNSSRPAQLQALAYTQGSDIHIAPGEERHLPHEAWHVVQQKRGAVKANTRLDNGSAINDSPSLEQEAERMGNRAKGLGISAPPSAQMETPHPLSMSNAPQQFKTAGEDVIQRQVITWGGTFTESGYAPKTEKDSNGTLIGSYIKITFTPNDNCPKNVKIGLMQIVRVFGAAENNGLQKDALHSTQQWAIDRQSDSNPVYGSSDPYKGPKSKELTDNPPSLDTERQNPLDKRSPMIEVGAQLGESRAVGGQAAILTDDPRIYLNRGIEQKMLFETTAVVLEGKNKGLALGTVSWGWTKPAGATTPVLEAFAHVNDSGSSDNFTAARGVWNAAAKDHELVPIPAIKSTPKKCFLTTACVEYKGLGDDCEELSTLRAFRDGYLMQKPNGRELVEMYYDYSPAIVDVIEAQENKAEILENLYGVIRQCVDAIQADHNEWAYQTYCRMVVDLKQQWIPEVDMPDYTY